MVNTTWKKLKDWLRPHCTPDWVEIHEKSTSGWVRVHGLENFEKAWSKFLPPLTFTQQSSLGMRKELTGLPDRMDGGVFCGRVLVASKRNQYESIKVKVAINVSPRSTNAIAEHPLTQPASPVLNLSPVSSCLSLFQEYDEADAQVRLRMVSVSVNTSNGSQLCSGSTCMLCRAPPHRALAWPLLVGCGVGCLSPRPCRCPLV